MSKKLLNKEIEKKRLSLEKELYEESLINPLMKNYVNLPEYYKTWINGSKLIAVLPALPGSDENSQSYYSVESRLGDSHGRLSPVFAYENKIFNEEDYFNNNTEKIFLFDSEFNKLYKSTQKVSGGLKFIKSEDYDTLIKEINDKPFVLFFLGCDDGHIGKRFKNKDDAVLYLNLLTFFEDVFDDEYESHN